MSKVSCLTLHVYCENSVFLMAWERVERFLFREGRSHCFPGGRREDQSTLTECKGGEGGRGYRKLTANEVRSLEYFKALRGVR